VQKYNYLSSAFPKMQKSRKVKVGVETSYAFVPLVDIEGGGRPTKVQHLI
jgi:hypothetical protein